LKVGAVCFDEGASPGCPQALHLQECRRCSPLQ
jgi:hypothetical protein